MKVDWSAMTGEQILESVTSAPVVMKPWEGWLGKPLTAVGTHTFFSRHSDARLYTWQGGTKHACVQTMYPAPGWSWSLGYNKGDSKYGFTTATEAVADVDREMKARGWVLIGETLPP